MSWSPDRRAYKPAWWLPGGHAQTLAGKLLRPRPDVPLEQERLETPDGDFLAAMTRNLDNLDSVIQAN